MNIKSITLLVASTLLVCHQTSATASEPMQGCLLATESCPATISIKKQSNPDQLRLTPGENYRITARNKYKDATHYQLSFDNNSRPQRWVSIGCGEFVESCGLAPAVSAPRGERYLLAISWQPAFCELHSNKTECRSQTETRFDATHFSLHGLWPQPRDNAYCGVSESNKAIDRRGRWDLLPDADISKATLNQLREVMPGVASELHEHEWTKHGTCYGSDADTYYQDSMRVLAMINNSPIQDLFADNIEERLTVKTIQSAFDQHFGVGSGQKVGVRCDRNNNISELFVNLRGDLASQDLDELLANADRGDSNCRGGSGTVDAVGSPDESWFMSWLRSLF